MEIDSRTIRALSADARIRILKMLSGNRRIAADISKELGLAPSTVNEHLKMMEGAGLVMKRDTGHKWIYYEISEKGKNLIAPKVPVSIILALSLGIAMVFFGAANFFMENAAYPAISGIAQTTMQETAQKISSATPGASAGTQAAASSPLLGAAFLILIVAGIFIIAFSLMKLRKR